MGEAMPLGEITGQHFDAAFGMGARGTLFTVQKALPLSNDGGSIFMTGSIASIKGFPGSACMRRARFLGPDDPSFVNGVELHVDGGTSAI